MDGWIIIDVKGKTVYTFFMIISADMTEVNISVMG